MGKRIAVVGVGALGGYVGGWLAHTGEDVTLIDFWPENIETIRSKGLSLDGVTPEEKITVKNAKTMHLTEMEALSRQKPIVAVKSARRPSAMHRPPDAGDDVVVDALFRQTGVIRVDTVEQLFDVAQVLVHQPLPAGRRVAIVGNEIGRASCRERV